MGPPLAARDGHPRARAYMMRGVNTGGVGHLRMEHEVLAADGQRDVRHAGERVAIHRLLAAKAIVAECLSESHQGLQLSEGHGMKPRLPTWDDSCNASEAASFVLLATLG